MKKFFKQNYSFSKIIFSFSLLMSISLMLSAAAQLNPLTVPYSTIASFVVNERNLEFTTTTYAYRPWFENGAWQGDIIQYDLFSNGTINTSVDASTTPPTNALGGTNWSARLQFDKKAPGYFTNPRKIITTSGAGVNAGQIPFTWNRGLTTTQKTTLDANPVNANNILDFIRGDRSNEVNGSPGGLLRQRYSILGDIIHSDPVYVPAPNSRLYDAGYGSFKNLTKLREPRLYVGANDGMLHVFDAKTGDEVYAYIPSMLISKLNLLSKVPYMHQYYVDGGLTAGDMDFGSKNWHSVLIGSLGAGGKGLFALDITDANLTSERSSLGSNNKVLWELDGNNPDIGYIFDKSKIAKLPDGQWYIITGNGYGSTNDVASLLLIDSQGNVTTLEADNAIINNGLSRPALVDINGDGAVDYAYAGDLQGNLYRFDLNTKLKADLLFSAGVDKPITTAPKIANHPYGGRIILFGTGSLLSNVDVKDQSIQSIYGIRDFDTAQFISNTITSIETRTLSTDIAVLNPVVGRADTVRVIANLPPPTVAIMDWTTKDGWQVDLPPGERIVLDPNLRASRFQVMSINPVSKEGWLLQLNYYDGTAKKIFYDLNNDGLFNGDDTVNRQVNLQGKPVGFGDNPIAIKQGVGSFSRQLITRIKNGVDGNFINGLTIQDIVYKTGKVAEGFARGHIDVDTDSPLGGQSAANIVDRYCYELGNRAAGIAVDASGVTIPPSTNSPFQRLGPISNKLPTRRDGIAGTTDGHQHEYDKIHGTVEVDYINLELHCRQKAADNSGTAKRKLNRVTEAGIGNSKKFFVIIANADLSPGSELNIGNESWNVVVYQKMIQQKLEAWKTAGANATDFATIMVDNGRSLIYSHDKIIATVDAGTGKFTNSFNNRAIIDGGLHPTQTGCVNDPEKLPSRMTFNQRWRNGALVTQLIDVENYKLDRTTVVKQTPLDLIPKIQINGKDIILKEITGETYGGLLANGSLSITGKGATNNAFLYESTLFWHFGYLYDLVFGKKPCYGDASWGAAKAYELAGISAAELTALLNDPTNKLGKANQKLQAAITRGDSKSAIAKLRNDFNTILDKINDYVNTPGSVTNQPVTIGTPVITRNNSVIDNNLGTGASMGRRSWIDIRP